MNHGFYVFFCFALQYLLQWQNASINGLIEEAILEAEEKGIKVISLGLLNQASFVPFLSPRFRVNTIPSILLVFCSIKTSTRAILVLQAFCIYMAHCENAKAY